MARRSLRTRTQPRYHIYTSTDGQGWTSRAWQLASDQCKHLTSARNRDHNRDSLPQGSDPSRIIMIDEGHGVCVETVLRNAAASPQQHQVDYITRVNVFRTATHRNENRGQHLPADKEHGSNFRLFTGEKCPECLRFATRHEAQEAHRRWSASCSTIHLTPVSESNVRTSSFNGHRPHLFMARRPLVPYSGRVALRACHCSCHRALVNNHRYPCPPAAHAEARERHPGIVLPGKRIGSAGVHRYHHLHGSYDAKAKFHLLAVPPRMRPSTLGCTCIQCIATKATGGQRGMASETIKVPNMFRTGGRPSESHMSSQMKGRQAYPSFEAPDWSLSKAPLPRLRFSRRPSMTFHVLSL